ncbi:hypothetical protein I6G56_30795 [Burkholderia humptydooensis]|uniref:Uncharacterized protein n=2 Tax=Burkholderia humptydooensis TaxID=430531 RepID=A0A7U4P8N3_9BURK|nr:MULTISPECIES: DUF6232 family protein [Burkholderia]AJY38794.1 hypothetical protein BW21_3986 [Burkholderia sp. 2002721687]ALX45003.1 hypothetical protein AQ610_20965 [Burkholderia humptydooensis]QPS48024.1 hypothetical protein I6G56_30795 [Burkholderia humptydooensis]
MENAFNERGVTVTRNSLSAAGQIFALREIRGVEVRTVRKNKIVPCAISLTGAAAAAAGGTFGSGALLVAGVMLVVVGYLAWMTQDVTHRLIVDMPGGKHEALMSVDRDFVERVAHAVNAARTATAAA